jgi:hypothetical protein
MFYLESPFPLFNPLPSPAPEINILKPSEDHLLAEGLYSDYGLVMTHTLVVSLCLPWIFYSSWSSLSPGNLELSNFTIFLFPPHIPFHHQCTLKSECVCVCVCVCVCLCVYVCMCTLN